MVLLVYSAVMAGVWFALHLLFFLFTSISCLDVSLVQVPTNEGISGVFLVQTKSNSYSFNATTAKEACEAVRMRIAKRAEVETANKNGLQTCRFGWVEEQIAVIPRIEKNEKCGKSAVGVSVWAADLSKNFDVYCYKPPGPAESFETTSTRPPPTREGTTPSDHYSSTTISHPSSTKTVSSPASTSRSLPPYTSSPSISSDSSTFPTTFVTFSLSDISESSQTTSSHRSLSFPTTSTKFSSSSSSHFLLQHFSSSIGQPVSSQTATPDRPSMRADSKTFVIISVVLLFFLAAAGAAWYLKIKRGQQIPAWTYVRPKLINETEMWKRITERHCTPEQISKDNTSPWYDNIILQMEPDSS